MLSSLLPSSPNQRCAGAPPRWSALRGWASGRSLRTLGWFCLLSSATSCQRPLDSIQVILERHHKAVAKLPESERERLMPYGKAVVSDMAESLLPADVLTLQEARAIAVRANPDVHAAQARLAAAAARIDQARARYFPSVVFSYSGARTFHTPASRNRLNLLLQPPQPAPVGVDTTNFTLTSLINALRRPLFGDTELKGDRNSYSEHSIAFTAQWTAFDGFVREAQVMASKYLYRATTMNLVDVERLIVQAVDRAYYQVQLAEEEVRIARAAEAFSQEQFEETDKLRAAGRATQADVDNFRVRVLAAQATVTNAVGLRDVGRVVLAELLGLTDGILPADLILSPLAEESAVELAVPPPEPWIERALSNRPDVVQFMELLKAEDENVRAARGLYSPAVLVSGSWGFDRSSNLHYSVEDQSSAAALEFRWELFTGGARHARVREAESKRAETAAQLNRLRFSVQSDVRRAIIDLNDAQQQILLQRESLRTAAENRRVVRAGYLAGRETLSRLNETQRDFIAAEVGLAQARIRLRLAWSDLNAAAATYHPTEETESGAAPPPELPPQDE